MAIRMECSCGKAFDVPDSFAGKSGKCKSCGQKLIAPNHLSAETDSSQPPVSFFASSDDIQEQRERLKPPALTEQEPLPSYVSSVLLVKRSRWKRRALLVAVVALIFIAGLTVGLLGEKLTQKREGVAIDEPMIPTPERKELRLPPGVRYEIIRDEEEYNPFTQKHFVDVYLNRRVGMDTLQAISDEIARNEEHRYQRRFVAYYLSSDIEDKTRYPWARTNYLPASDFGKGEGMYLDKKIDGLTIEDKEWLDMQPPPVCDELIGEWEDTMFPTKISIFRRDGELKIAHTGARSKLDPFNLKEFPDTPNRCFQTQGSTEMFEITPDGNARLYSREMRLIAKYPRWVNGNN